MTDAARATNLSNLSKRSVGMSFRGILNEFVDDDKDDADLTYETKMQQLINRLLSYDPTSGIDPLTEATMGAKMNADVASCEDAANSSGDNVDEPNALALEGIYGEEVFNDADDLIDDDPTPTETTQEPPSKRRRRRKRVPKFQTRHKDGKSKGKMKSAYTYQKQLKPRAAKVNAAIAIESEEQTTDSNNDDESNALSLSQADERHLISLYYVHLGAPPPEEWNGVGGTVSKIVSALSYSKFQRRRVKEIIANYHFTTLVGGVYDPQRKHRSNPTAIEDGGPIQQMICDYIESGVSYTEAQLLVNIWCVKNDKLTVTRSAVVSCVERMMKRVSLISKRPQGHTDPNSDWARCRFRLAAQMLLRFGEDLGEYQHLLDKILGETEDLPACLDPTCLPTLDLTSIVFYDVRHDHPFDISY
jgi:phage terminase small subunit